MFGEQRYFGRGENSNYTRIYGPSVPPITEALFLSSFFHKLLPTPSDRPTKERPLCSPRPPRDVFAAKKKKKEESYLHSQLEYHLYDKYLGTGNPDGPTFKFNAMIQLKTMRYAIASSGYIGQYID